MKVSKMLKMPMHKRLDLMAENIRRMFRTGAQSALTGLALSDATPVNGFEMDYLLLGSFFVGGCVMWVLTTLAAPPKD